MRVVCLNDSDQPEQIPLEKRVIKYEVYTVEKVVKLAIKGDIAFSLKELPLNDECFPYEYWAAERFVPEEYYNEKIKFNNVKFEIPLDIQ